MPVDLMSRLQPRLASILLALCAVAPAHASHWMLVGAEGDHAPDRRLTFAEFNNLVTRLDMPLDQAASAGADALLAAKVWRVRVVQVLEAREAPDTISYDIDVHCGRKQTRIAEAIAFARDATTTTTTPNQWADVGGGWPARVHLIACERPKLEKAVAAAKKGNVKPLTDLGMVYVGEHVFGTQLSDVTWTHFWKDGVRPAYTTHRTPEEVEQRRREGLALAEQTAVRAQGVEKEAVFMLEVGANFERKSHDHQSELAGMEGWTEQRVIDAWGAPQSSAQGGETRSLVYEYVKPRYDVVDTTVDLMSAGGGKVGELRQSHVQTSMQPCKRMLSFRQGGSTPGWRLYDYRYDCP